MSKENTTPSADKPQNDEEVVTIKKEEYETLQKRLQDNRNSFLKASQSLKEKELLAESLRQQLEASKAPQLSKEASEELEELKFSDPDAWFNRKRELEKQASEELQKRLSTVEDEVRTKAKVLTEKELLEHYQSENPTHDLNAVPYSMRLQYEQGSISLDEFLGQAKDFYTSKQTLATPQTPETPDVSSQTGSSEASKGAGIDDIPITLI